MLQTILHEPSYIEQTYNEYLSLIKKYQNISRNSALIKYYNTDVDLSQYEGTLKSTYDLYNISDIYFNIYDFTPCFFMQPTVNRSGEMPDQQGVQWTGTSSVVIYTIQYPKVHDLITFYKPHDTNDIFRVVNISTALNSYKSVPFYELELEYAPLSTLTNLKIKDEFIYNLAQETNLHKKEYLNNLQYLENIHSIMLSLYTKYYNSYLDVYIINNYIISVLNELIYSIKSNYNIDFNRVLNKVKSPHGYKYYFEESVFNNNFNDLNFANMPAYNLELNTIENIDITSYNEIIDLYNMYRSNNYV